MPVFLALGLIGFGLLLFSLAFNHDHDFDHGDVSFDHDMDHDISDSHGPSWFNLKIIASFLAAFGFGGVIARYYDQSYMVSSLIGIGSGFALGFLIYQLLGFVYRQQASSHVTTAEILGKKGYVTVRIAPNQPGEVILSAKGSQYSYVARTPDGNEINEGSAIEVVELLGETAIVKPVNQP